MVSSLIRVRSNQAPIVRAISHHRLKQQQQQQKHTHAFIVFMCTYVLCSQLHTFIRCIHVYEQYTGSPFLSAEQTRARAQTRLLSARVRVLTKVTRSNITRI